MLNNNNNNNNYNIQKQINELVLGPDGKDATPGSFMDGKTPLLVDNSEDRKMATFFKYKVC